MLAIHPMGMLTCSSSSSSSSIVETVMVLYFDPMSLVYRRIITYNIIIIAEQPVELLPFCLVQLVATV